MWQVIKLCEWVSSLFLYMFKITLGKQAKYHFQYFGLIEAFVILQKRGHTREGLAMCWFYHCIYHDIICAVLAVLIGYWSCANTCITLGHHRIDNQASLTLGLNGVCFYILFVSSPRKYLWLQCIWMMGGFQVAQMREIQMNWAQLSIFYQIFKMADREDGPQDSKVLRENK